MKRKFLKKLEEPCGEEISKKDWKNPAKRKIIRSTKERKWEN